MRTFRSLLSATLISAMTAGLTTTALSVPVLAQTTAPNAIRQDVRAFLDRMGYRDYPTIIAQNLQSPEGRGLPQLNREVLESNQTRYAVITQAGNLASDLLARLIPHLATEEGRDGALKLTARLLAMRPVAVPELYPDTFQSIVNNDQLQESKINYLAKAVSDALVRQKEQILSDSLSVIYGADAIQKSMQSGSDKAALEKEISKLRESIGQYVDAINFDPDMGQTRFLGQAMSLGLTRYARQNHLPDLERDLAKATLQEGEILGNYVTDEVSFVNYKGQMQKVKFHNGDFAMENSGPDSASTSAAIEPGTWKGLFISIRESLIGSLVLSKIVGDAGTSLLGKVKSGVKLNFWERIRYFLSQRRIMIRGNSHGGAVQVYADRETGLSRVEILDSYPRNTPDPKANHGGIRIMGPEQFAGEAGYSILSVVHYDPVKFLHHLQKQFADKQKFNEAWWKSDVFELNDKGELIKVEGQVYEWKSQATEEFRQRILKAKDAEAQALFDQMAAKAMNRMLEYGTKTGMGFAGAGEMNARGMGYCTFTVAAAWRETTNADIQTVPDRYRPLVRFLAKRGKAPGVDLGLRIYSPNGPATDAMRASHDRVEYPRLSPVEKALRRSAPVDTDLSPETTALLQPYTLDWKQKSDERTKNFQYWMWDLIENNGVARQGRSDVVNLTPTNTLVPEADRSNDGDRRDLNPVAQNSVYSLSESKENPKSVIERQRALLTSLGFQGAMGAPTIDADQTSRQTVATARELSARIMSVVATRSLKADQMQVLAEVTARALTLRPLPPPMQVPDRLRLIRDEKARDQELKKYLLETIKTQIDQQSVVVTSDLATLLYKDQMGDARIQEEIKLIHQLVHFLIERMYLDPQVAQARPLGMGLAILGLKDAKGEKVFAEALNDQLGMRNLNLDTFFGSSWKDFASGAKNWLTFSVGTELLSGQFTHQAITARGRLDEVQKAKLRAGLIKGLDPTLVDPEHTPYGVQSELQLDVTQKLLPILSAVRPHEVLPSPAELEQLRVRMIDEFLTPLAKRAGLIRPGIDGTQKDDAMKKSGVTGLTSGSQSSGANSRAQCRLALL